MAAEDAIKGKRRKKTHGDIPATASVEIENIATKGKRFGAAKSILLKGLPTEATYSVKAAKTNAPINVATPIAVRARKKWVMPSNVGVGAIVELKARLMPPKKGPSFKIGHCENQIRPPRL
jgi:hypothetical protein